MNTLIKLQKLRFMGVITSYINTDTDSNSHYPLVRTV